MVDTRLPAWPKEQGEAPDASLTVEMAFGNYILQNSISIFGGGQIQTLAMNV